ncbi:MAG: hypothetical protein MI975_22235 [Cytophagales bacterium]|nr:hypothetical protein [Cytophagales bacterium]
MERAKQKLMGLNANWQWWDDFWKASYLFVSSPVDSLRVFNMSRGYQLQRYINARWASKYAHSF